MVPPFLSLVPVLTWFLFIWTYIFYGGYKDQTQFYILLSKFNNKPIAFLEYFSDLKSVNFLPWGF